jgi:hypothetical protein
LQGRFLDDINKFYRKDLKNTKAIREIFWILYVEFGDGARQCRNI